MSQLYDICRVVSRRISHFLSMKANTNVHGNYSLRPFFKKKKKKKNSMDWHFLLMFCGYCNSFYMFYKNCFANCNHYLCIIKTHLTLNKEVNKIIFLDFLIQLR